MACSGAVAARGGWVGRGGHTRGGVLVSAGGGGSTDDSNGRSDGASKGESRRAGALSGHSGHRPRLVLSCFLALLVPAGDAGLSALWKPVSVHLAEGVLDRTRTDTYGQLRTRSDARRGCISGVGWEGRKCAEPQTRTVQPQARFHSGKHGGREARKKRRESERAPARASVNFCPALKRSKKSSSTLTGSRMPVHGHGYTHGLLVPHQTTKRAENRALCGERERGGLVPRCCRRRAWHGGGEGRKGKGVRLLVAECPLHLRVLLRVAPLLVVVGHLVIVIELAAVVRSFAVAVASFAVAVANAVAVPAAVGGLRSGLLRRLLRLLVGHGLGHGGRLRLSFGGLCCETKGGHGDVEPV